jgi:hypothetical protein
VQGEKLADAGGSLLRGPHAEPFVPGHDAVSGFFVIEAADEAAARSIAATCPHLDEGGTIELRPIEDL